MKTAFIIHAPADRAAATGVSEALDAVGTRTASRPLRGDRYEIETLAARMKGADLAVVLLSHASAASREFRRDLHLALLYDRPLAVGQLDRAASADAFAADREVLIGTPYAERPEGLKTRLERAVFIGVEPAAPVESAPQDEDAAPEPAASADLPATSSGAPTPATSIDNEPAPEPPFDQRVQPLIERIRKELAVAGSPPRADEGDADALGFPKSPEAMLARWRLIEPTGVVTDFRAFYEDYGDDPYFGPLSAETLGALERKRFYRGAGGVLRWSLGTVAAAALFAAGLHFCADGGCSFSSSDSATRTGPSLAAAALSAGDDRAALERAIAGLEEENGDLSIALQDARAAGAELKKALAAAKRERAQAEATAENARKQAEAAAAEARAAEAQIETASQRRLAAESGLELERKRAEETEKQLARLREEIAALKTAEAGVGAKIEDDVARLTEERAALEEAVAKAQAEAKAAAAEAEKAVAAAELRATETARAQAEAEAAAREAEEMYAAMKERAETAETDLATTLKRLDTVEAALSAAENRAERQAAALRSGQSDSQRAVADAEARAEETRREAVAAQTEAAETALELDKAKAEIARLEAALTARPKATAMIAAPTAATPPAPAPSSVGAVRLLERLETRLSTEDKRRRTSGVRDFMRGPTLGGAELRKLQACLKEKTGAPSSVDGLWGVQTTRAVLALTTEQAEEVADCLEL